MFKSYSLPKDLPRPLKITRITSKIVAFLGVLVFVPLLFISVFNGKAKNFDAMVLDSQGNMYLYDSASSLVRKYDSQGTFLISWGGAGTGDGQFGSSFSSVRIAIGPGDDVFTLDAINHRVQKFNAGGKFLTKWGNQGQFGNLTNIAVDGQGNVYVSGNDVQRFDKAGNYLGTLTGTLPDKVSLYPNLGMTVDNAGILFVMGKDDREIYAFAPDNKLIKTLTLIGIDSSQLYNSKDLAVDTQGNFYLRNDINNQILKFDRDGKLLKTWPIKNSNDYFSFFRGLAIDSRNNIYILNQQDEQVLVFDSNGQSLRQISIGWFWLTKNMNFFTIGFSLITLFISILNSHYTKKYKIKPKPVNLKASTRAGKASQIINITASILGLLVGMPWVIISSVLNPASIFSTNSAALSDSQFSQATLFVILITGLNSLVLILVFYVKKNPLFTGIIQIAAGVALFFIIPVTVVKVLSIAILVGGALALGETNEKQPAPHNS